MQTSKLSNLLEAYRNAPKEFRATSYWHSYEEDILDTISSIDIEQLRSGKYPILATFGFNDIVYYYHHNFSIWRKIILTYIQKRFSKHRETQPYGLCLSEIREMAYHHCELSRDLNDAVSIGNIEMSTFGNPVDLFEINGKKYSMAFLGYYLRYCFAHKHISFQGDEIIVELGSGSGHQVEVLKKLYPELTILCFDLPAQLFLCEKYLSEALGKENIVSTEETLKWKESLHIKKGCVHFLGNWQFPLLKGLQFDVFWNAASFGEMEPDIVGNYLTYIKGSAKWIYLTQARHGKEVTGNTRVEKPITFDDYGRLLSGYVLQEQHDAYQAARRLSQSGGYFEGVWMKQ